MEYRVDLVFEEVPGVLRQAQAGLPDVYRYVDPIVGDTFYMSTTLDALNRRVVAVLSRMYQEAATSRRTTP